MNGTDNGSSSTSVASVDKGYVQGGFGPLGNRIPAWARASGTPHVAPVDGGPLFIIVF